jgi:hypothetical protein
MSPWSDDLTNEEYEHDAAVVCLAHGRFVPCRGDGEHQDSSDPADVAKVRYYQEMSARDSARPVLRRLPVEYVKVTTSAWDWPLHVTDAYGSDFVACDSTVLQERAGGKYLMMCDYSFGGFFTPRELMDALGAHITATGHHEARAAGS